MIGVETKKVSTENFVLDRDYIKEILFKILKIKYIIIIIDNLEITSV